MKWKNLVKVAFKSILKNRMRSFLTVLGIVIGVGAVIALVSLGKGASADIESQISSLGTNMIMVRHAHSFRGGVSHGAGSLNTLTLEDVEKLQAEGTYLKYVSPVVNAGGQIIFGGSNWSTNVQGVSPEYLEIRNWPIEKGSFFTDRDVRSRRKVAVLGKSVVKELFKSQDPIGARIRIGNVPFTVIGVLSSKGQATMGDQDDIILAPYTTVFYRMTDGTTINSISASAVSNEKMPAAMEQTTALLREAHKLKPSDEDDFSIRSQTEIIDAVTGVTKVLTMLLGAIAGISLLVGGIGIMNIMLVSVTERTREIGIRMAIGARGGDIMIQFLIEAIILSMIGGGIGILSGLGLGKLISGIINSSLIVDPIIIIAAFLFSGSVGVFFGFYPARKAARLNPIEALRYE